MDIDVVIPSAGDPVLLARTLPSVVAAVDAIGLRRERVTVVDDRPERAIGGLLESLGLRRLPGGRLGRSRARNAGLEVGSAPWVVFVDDDVELDPTSFHALVDALANRPYGVLGGLRPPADAPAWLWWTYEDAVLTGASAPAGPAELKCVSLSSALCALPRADVERAGGFPDVKGWGGEDVLLGMALERMVPEARLHRVPAFGGIHHFVPSFEAWLERRETAGRQLAVLERELPFEQGAQLLRAFGHQGGPRATLKRAAGYLPPDLLRRARGRSLRRMAAAAMEVRGYRMMETGREA